MSLSNQKCMIQPTFINLHPNECSQEFYYYPFGVKLDRCVGSCNTRNDLLSKVCALNKTEDLNRNVLNITTGINESKTLRKHTLCERKCKFDERKCNLNQWWNNINVDVSVKNLMHVEKIIFRKILYLESCDM